MREGAPRQFFPAKEGPIGPGNPETESERQLRSNSAKGKTKPNGRRFGKAFLAAGLSLGAAMAQEKPKDIQPVPDEAHHTSIGHKIKTGLGYAGVAAASRVGGGRASDALKSAMDMVQRHQDEQDSDNKDDSDESDGPKTTKAKVVSALEIGGSVALGFKGRPDVVENIGDAEELTSPEREKNDQESKKPSKLKKIGKAAVIVGAAGASILAPHVFKGGLVANQFETGGKTDPERPTTPEKKKSKIKTVLLTVAKTGLGVAAGRLGPIGAIENTGDLHELIKKWEEQHGRRMRKRTQVFLYTAMAGGSIFVPEELKGGMVVYRLKHHEAADSKTAKGSRFSRAVKTGAQYAAGAAAGRFGVAETVEGLHGISGHKTESGKTKAAEAAPKQKTEIAEDSNKTNNLIAEK